MSKEGKGGKKVSRADGFRTLHNVPPCRAPHPTSFLAYSLTPLAVIGAVIDGVEQTAAMVAVLPYI